MNRDEAEKCVEGGKQYLRGGNIPGALKFFLKAARLHPDPSTDALIKVCQEKLHKDAHDKTHKANLAQAQSQEQASSSTSVSYTPEQVLSLKDFYDILGVPKNSPSDVMKKAYRKLALKLHPDKNPAPQAQEAFKKIAQAYDCLSNPEKKEIYDRYGNEDPDSHIRHYRENYSEEVRPEDIFSFFFSQDGGNDFHNLFFGNGHGNINRQRRRQPRPQAAQANEKPNLRMLLQFLPFILLIFSSSIGNFFTKDPVYSFYPSSKYRNQITTRNLGIQYYVENSFGKEYMNDRSKLNNIEYEIESTYLEKIKNECEVNTSYKKRLEYQARYTYDDYTQKLLLKKAQEINVNICDQYVEFKQKIRQFYR